MPKACLFPCLLLSFIFSSVSPARIPSVATGTVTMISAFNGSQTNSPVTIPATYTVSLATAAPSLKVAVSLMSFQSMISVQFIFNTTVSAVSASSMQVTFTSLSSTYFKNVEIHYLVAKHPTIDILTGCFYSGIAKTGTGPRNQNFYNFTTPIVSANPPLEITPAISGLKAGNTLGSLYSIVVKAINGGTTLVGGITHTKVVINLQTEEQCLVEWVCVSVIIYKPMQISSETYLRATTNIGFLMGTSGIQTYPAVVLIPDVMFFGLSSIKLNMLQATQHRFILSTSNPAMPTVLTTNANSQSLTLQQFFVWDAACGTGYVDTSTSARACVTTCPANYYNNPLGFCLGCSASILYCAVCNAAGCTNCTAGLLREQVGGVCRCILGYFDNNGTCVACNLTLPYCTNCSSASVCNNCNSTNITYIDPTPLMGKCVCLPNYYMVTGMCKRLAGCLIMNNITSGVYCQQCSTALNFVMAVNQTCVCINSTYFNVTTSKCEGPCGDGKSLDNTCDDGDTDDYNGCANNCTTSTGFHCTNPNRYAPSVCVPIRNFTANYLYAAKDTASSTAFLYFYLQPDDPTLPQMDFSSLVQTTIPLSQLKATYMSNGNGSGTLVVAVGYTQTIEKMTHNVTIYFDNAFVYAQQVEVPIAPSGINYQLAFNPIDSFNSIISMLAAVVGILALFIAIASSVLGYKLIGFEVLLPVQIMYFSISTLNHTYSALGALRSLNYSNGYNKIGPAYTFADAVRSLPGLMVMQRSTEFLVNLNFSAVPLLVGFAVAMAMRVGIGEKKVQDKKQVSKKNRKNNITIKIENPNPLDNAQADKSNKDTPNQEETVPKEQAKPVPVDKCEQAYVFLVDRVLVSLWVSLLLNTVFSFVVQTVCPVGNTSYLPLGANVGAALFFFLLGMMCLVLLTGKIYDREFRITFHIKSRKYPVYLIALYMVQALVLGSTFYDSPASAFLSLALSALPALLVLKKQPHNTLLSLHGITAFYCQLLPPITFVLLLMSRSLDGSSASLLALGMLVGGLIGEGLSVVRLVVHLREDYLKRKEEESIAKAEKEDVELQSIAHETIKKSLPHGDPLFRWDASQKRLREADIDSELQDEQEENDEDQLARIKLRLKKELINKRGQA